MSVSDNAVGGVPFRGLVPTIYDGNRGAAVGFHAVLPLLKRARPEAIQLHTWSITTAAKAVRTAFPGIHLIAGFGIDGIARKVVNKQITVAQAAKEFLKLADSAVQAGCLVVVWNAEVAYKAELESAARALIVAAVRAGLAAVAEKYPDLRQWMTSYDHPTYHTQYPWEAWLGKDSPILAALPQVYAAPLGEVMAQRGALRAREARAFSSWLTAIRKGWIRADAPDGPEDMRDVDWLPYVQLHHVQTRDTVDLCTRYPLSFGWALPTRADDAGRDAFLVASALHRLGHHGPNAVQDFQRARLLAVDGKLGPLTIAAALSALDGMNAAGKDLAP